MIIKNLARNKKITNDNISNDIDMNNQNNNNNNNNIAANSVF